MFSRNPRFNPAGKDASGMLVTPQVAAGSSALDALLAGVRTPNFAVGNMTINFAGATISPAKSWVYGREYVYGAPLPTSDGFVSPNSLVVSDTADASAQSFLDAFVVAHRIGAGAKGGRNAVHASMGVVGAAIPGSGDFVALLSDAFSTANAGGNSTPFTASPATQYVGQLFGGNDHPRLAGGASYWYAVIGREINVEIESGASAFAKVGLFVVRGQNDAVQAAGEVDAAIVVANKANSTVPWKKGLLFGASWGSWAFDATSTLIGAQKRLYPTSNPETVINANYGVDFRDVTFANAAFASTGFSVANDGALSAKRLILADAQSIAFGGAGYPRLKGSAGGEVLTLNTAENAYVPLVTRFLSINDGTAAPAAQSGFAKLYVDNTDGDLKIVFGDGVIKTIVVDT